MTSAGREEGTQLAIDEASNKTLTGAPLVTVKDLGLSEAELAGANEIEDPTFRLELAELLEATPSVLSVFFDHESNHWCPWNEMVELSRGARRRQLHSRSSTSDSKAINRFFYDFVPTTDSARLSFLIEGLLTAGTDLVLVGEAGSGKSWLMRNILYEQLPVSCGSRVTIAPMVLYQHSVVANTQKEFEAPLEKKRKGRCGPPFGTSVVYFVEDLTMGKKDRYGRSDLLEWLR